MKISNKLSLNQIIRPESSVSSFLKFALECGFTGIELRNDLPDNRVLGSETPEQIKKTAADTGIEILTVNALQRFNDPALLENKKQELKELIETAKSVSCPMIILCPVNDPDDKRSKELQQKDLVAALKGYADIFNINGMTGLIEPLGFEICSVRTKAQAVAAIREANLSSVYKTTHDTFHHYLAGETEVFPEETGLIHISGVLPGKKKAEITDDDRILVTKEDCMGNIEQIHALISGGYTGPISYEAFSTKVQVMDQSVLKQGLKDSIELMFG